MHSVVGPTVALFIPRHSLDSCPPSLVIEAVQEPLSVMTLTPEELDEGSLELSAGAGVDHWVDAAVEVAQPKDHLEYSFRWLQCWEEGS